MYFTIPEIVDDDTTHKETSWKLARDVGMKHIEDNVVKSSTNLLAWSSNVIIPTGEVWYLSVYRHIYDENNNELDRLWSTPKPVFNDESNINDALIPKYEIKEPFISNLTYNPENGLTFKVSPYEGNVSYVDTLISVNDVNGNLLFSTFKNTENNNNVLITPEEIHFVDYNHIIINVVFKGNHSVVSKLGSSSIYLKKIYYNIKGNKIDIDPTSVNVLIIEGNTVVPITILSATVVNYNNDFISNCEIGQDVLTLPNNLEYNNSYKINVTLIYTDENDTQRTIDDVIYITTKTVGEKDVIDDKFEYEFNLTEVYKTGINNNEFDIRNINYSTEEFYTNVIPLPTINNDISTYIFDDEFKTLHRAKSDIYNYNDNFSIRLLTEKYAVLQDIDSNNKLKIYTLKYDCYHNTLSYLHSYSPNIHTGHPDFVNTVIVNNEIFVIGVDNDHRERILIYKLDIENNGLTLLYTYKTTHNWTTSSVVFSKNEILITPHGSDSSKLLVYSISDNYVYESLTLPSKFIDNSQMSMRLKNGGILNILTEENNGKLEYFYIDPKTKLLTTNTIEFNANGKIKNNILLKNGKILFIVFDSNFKYIYELN